MNTTVTEELASSLAAKGYWPARARIYFKEKKYSRAVELCLRMLDDEPDLISGRTILARSLFEAGQYDKAREQFLEILKRDPSHQVALRYLGDIMFHDGEKAAAIACYRRIFEIDPDCSGLTSPIRRGDKIQTRQLTLKRPAETAPVKDRRPLQEPAFITETVGDIYRDQGYFRLAGEVYRRLMIGTPSSRIEEKLREIEKHLGDEE